MKKKIIEITLTCGCGGISGSHEMGSEKCFREIAKGDLIPKNFRINERGQEVCDVSGHTITKYTLINQRCYHLDHGIWNLPKDHSSYNSVHFGD